jgi:fructan beta-fructosidase
MLGWINNWTYADKVPTSPWRGAFSLPRQLALRKQDDQYALIQRVIDETKTLRGNEIKDLEKFTGGSLEIKLDWSGGDGTILELFSNGDEKTTISLTGNTLSVDRTKSGIVNFQPDFASSDQVVLRNNDDKKITLHIFVDQSILEVYVNDGEASITSQIFPTGQNAMHIPLKDKVLNVEAWESKSIWK